MVCLFHSLTLRPSPTGPKPAPEPEAAPKLSDQEIEAIMARAAPPPKHVRMTNALTAQELAALKRSKASAKQQPGKQL